MSLRHYNEDGSGNIELAEMLTLAKGLAPSMSVEEAKQTFEFLDADGRGGAN